MSCVCKARGVLCTPDSCELAHEPEVGKPTPCPECRSRIKALAEKRVTEAPARSLLSLDACEHRGGPTGEMADCVGCGMKGKKSAVLSCAVHGKCTDRYSADLDGKRLKLCKGCPDRSDIKPKTWDMLLTGGIGDCIAVESLLTPEERETLRTVYYACPAATDIVKLFGTLNGSKSYPSLQHHIILPTGNRTCHSALDVEKIYPAYKTCDAKDFSIGKVFRQRRHYSGSCFLNSFDQMKLDQLKSKFRLPDRYFVIVPGSDWGQSPGREFDLKDWATAQKVLESRKAVGVVLRKKPRKAHRGLMLDLQGQTDLAESILILQGAMGYLGIDSWVSVLAAKLFSSCSMSVKSVRGHLYSNLNNYYTPRTSYGFVRKTLEVPSW